MCRIIIGVIFNTNAQFFLSILIWPISRLVSSGGFIEGAAQRRTSGWQNWGWGGVGQGRGCAEL